MCKGPASDQKAVSAAQLALRTDWISVDGEVFDLQALAAVHPGGDHIRAFGGTDATASFHSLHPYTAARNKRVLVEKFQVTTSQGEPLTVDGPSFPFVFDSPFATELKAAVRADLKERGASMHAGFGFWCRTALILALTLLCEWKWITTASTWAMVGAGVCHALIGLAVQHDASHGALSRSASVNGFFAYGADWIGNSRWLWFQQHVIGHHPHTNIEGVDGDAHSAEPFLQFHWAPVPSGVRSLLVRYQHLYMYAVLFFYGPSVVWDVKQVATMNHGREIPFPNPWMSSKATFAIAMRLFFYLRIVALPMLVGGASWYAAIFGVALVNGAILTFLFVLSHNFEGSERHPLTDARLKTRAEGGEGKIDWYAMQASTSCSYGGAVSGYLCGGLNMQIEHHLLPRMSSWEYPLIAPVVRRVCEKHNVRYVYYPSIWSNMKSTYRFMRAVGGLSAGAEGAEKPKVA